MKVKIVYESGPYPQWPCTAVGHFGNDELEVAHAETWEEAKTRVLEKVKGRLGLGPRPSPEEVEIEEANSNN